MTITAITTEPPSSGGRKISPLVSGSALLTPSLLFLSIFLVIPGVLLLSYSVMTQHTNGDIGLPLQVDTYRRLLFESNYRAVTLQTIYIAFVTTLVSIFLAYPLAMVIAYGNAFFSRLTIVLVIMPLVVSVIVRTYGWQLLLGNSQTGVINWMLNAIGLGGIQLQILYTKWAVIVASSHVFLPLIVLPIATSLGRINPSLVPAARMLGASPFRAFLRVTLPLSIPGLAIGVTIVFSLTAASYVTPALIGGSRGLMLGILLEQQMTAVYDWSMGAAIGVVMVAIILAVNIGIGWLLDRHMRVSAAGR